MYKPSFRERASWSERYFPFPLQTTDSSSDFQVRLDSITTRYFPICSHLLPVERHPVAVERNLPCPERLLERLPRHLPPVQHRKVAPLRALTITVIVTGDGHQDTVDNKRALCRLRAAFNNGNLFPRCVIGERTLVDAARKVSGDQDGCRCNDDACGTVVLLETDLNKGYEMLGQR